MLRLRTHKMSILDCFRKCFGPLIGRNLEIDKNSFIKEIGNNPGATSSNSGYISHNFDHNENLHFLFYI